LETKSYTGEIGSGLMRELRMLGCELRLTPKTKPTLPSTKAVNKLADIPRPLRDLIGTPRLNAGLQSKNVSRK
jgi:hypothetical protein